ncbi:hypothetical protein CHINAEXTREME_06710 [Halobiforma lacisalsi AJ5]|uniref:Uncharacterized protein n=2 Tax=Natronobacterium TaxID=2256 RepID=M0LVF7_NATLA|nr:MULTISPECIES: hypothetical protein [Halobiforma]APW97480.1 hypothetical protein CHINAEXTREME_06710 [Halobiforma lacisalsi AJ5]EMA37143.1 hypothetical protein C445_02846 [Halobiforma lacisalsi AJ5]SFB80235.1 hypothetical protein SAMN05444422_10291 [Halobiforma haloterrestris]
MVEARDGRDSSRILLAVVLGVAVALPIAATRLEVSPHRVTAGTVVVTALLLTGAIALPALIVAKWDADAGAQRDRSP